MSNKELSEISEELDDDQIREWFQSRDPDRKKVDPFLTEEAKESLGGKASPLTIKEEIEQEKSYGVSYSQHTKHIRDVARHFFFVGSSAALFVAIILAIIF